MGESSHARDRARPPDGLSDGSAAVAGARLQEIIDTAERVAAEISADVELAADRYSQERREEMDRIAEEQLRTLDGISRSLSARVATVHREALALVQDLDDAMRRLAALSAKHAPAPDAGRPTRAESPEPIAYPGTGRATVPDRARVRTAQMLAAGTARRDIERMLRAGFGIKDAEPIINEAVRMTPGAAAVD